MKRTFSLVHPKIKPARLVDSAKHEIKKFLKKERNTPTGRDIPFWDFDVKFGLTKEEAVAIPLKSLNHQMDTAEQNNAEQFYVEIIKVAGVFIESDEPETVFDVEPEAINPEFEDE